MRRKIFFGVALVAYLLSTACTGPVQLVEVKPGHGFASLFNGFAYVGNDVDPGSHNVLGQNIPMSFLPDHQYFFHHTRPFDSFKFAGNDLPERLSSLGFSVTKPYNEGRIGTSDPGGEFWEVQFSRGRCSGQISAQGCGVLTARTLFKDSRWTESDFVLTLRGQCGE
jgi:hypothetical protein